MLLVQCNSMLSAAAVYSNELKWNVLYSRVDPVMLDHAEMVVPWVYYHLLMMLN